MVQKDTVVERSAFRKNTSSKTISTDYNRTLVGRTTLTCGMLAYTRKLSVVKSMQVRVAFLRNNSGARQEFIYL